MTSTPRIYLACLASYNAGILHGEWVELDGSDDLHECLFDLLDRSPVDEATEWAVHDHEHCGHLGEYPGLERLQEIKATFLRAEAEDLDWELLCIFCDHAGHDLEPDTITLFNEAFTGSGLSLIDWCRQFFEDSGEIGRIPEHLRSYLDYSAYARDLEANDIFTIEHGGETHVFWNN